MKGQKRIWKKVTDTEEWPRRSKIRTTEDPKEENKIREQLTVKLYSRNSFWKKYLKWHTGRTFQKHRMTNSSKITRHLWTQEILFQWAFSEESTGKWASDKTKWLGRHQCKAWWWTL